MRTFLGLLSALLVAVPALAQDRAQNDAPPSPEKIELARRLLAATRDSVPVLEEKIVTGSVRLAPFSTAPEIYNPAARKVLDASQAMLARAQEDVVLIYARFYPEDAMRAALPYLESPLSKSVRDKEAGWVQQNLAKGAVPPPPASLFTDEENTARTAYYSGPARDFIQASEKTLWAEKLVLSLLNARLRLAVDEEFCNGGGKCSDNMIPTVRDEVKLWENRQAIAEHYHLP